MATSPTYIEIASLRRVDRFAQQMHVTVAIEDSSELHIARLPELSSGTGKLMQFEIIYSEISMCKER